MRCLRVSIEMGSQADATGPRLWFKQHSSAPIPLRVVLREAVPRWEAEVKRELAMPFQPGEAPLLRAVLLHGEERLMLLLAACHSVADGGPLALLIRDVLSAMAGQPMAVLPMPRAEDELLGFAALEAGRDGAVEDLNEPARNEAGAPSVHGVRQSRELTERLVAGAREGGDVGARSARGGVCAGDAAAGTGVSGEAGADYLAGEYTAGAGCGRCVWDVLCVAEDDV